MTLKQGFMKHKTNFIVATLAALTLFGCGFFQPSPTSQPACSVESVLATLRNSESFEDLLPEYSVNQSEATSVSYLNIWFVDPNIDPEAKSENLEENINSARLGASYAAIAAQAIDPYTASVFDRINPVVVDRAYNGWFSASVPVSKLPEKFPPSAQEVINVANAFDVVYYRQEVPDAIAAAPTGSCNWPETKKRMQSHFDPSRPNVDFYFVGDEVSRKVTSQWDGSINSPTDIGVIYASIMNVAQELSCLHPAPDFLEVMVVDDNGKLIYYARLPSSGIQSLDLNQLEIYYQAEIPR
jgi:hypothetical protein